LRGLLKKDATRTWDSADQKLRGLLEKDATRTLGSTCRPEASWSSRQRRDTDVGQYVPTRSFVVYSAKTRHGCGRVRADQKLRGLLGKDAVAGMPAGSRIIQRRD
ncbi:hypothetical protein LSAT2_019304, partial [Lamellibrachia satsuma]